MRRRPLEVPLRGQLTCSPPTPHILCMNRWDESTVQRSGQIATRIRNSGGGLPTMTLSPALPSVRPSDCDMRNSKDRRLGLAPSSQGYEHLPYFRHNLPTSGVMRHAASERSAEVPLALIFLNQRNQHRFWRRLLSVQASRSSVPTQRK
jgi:hypothetical protein